MSFVEPYLSLRWLVCGFVIEMVLVSLQRGFMDEWNVEKDETFIIFSKERFDGT